MRYLKKRRRKRKKRRRKMDNSAFQTLGSFVMKSVALVRIQNPGSGEHSKEPRKTHAFRRETVLRESQHHRHGDRAGYQSVVAGQGRKRGHSILVLDNIQNTVDKKYTPQR